MTEPLTDAKLQMLRDFFEGEQIMASNAVVRGNAMAARSVCDELIARRAADAQPAPEVDAVLLRDSRDIETATGRACPSCGFAHVTEGASKSHDWYCDHCQSYGDWDGSV